MSEPIHFSYAGKPWVMELRERPNRKTGVMMTVKSFKPDGHHPPVAQFIRAARAFNKRLDQQAGHA